MRNAFPFSLVLLFMYFILFRMHFSIHTINTALFSVVCVANLERLLPYAFNLGSVSNFRKWTKQYLIYISFNLCVVEFICFFRFLGGIIYIECIWSFCLYVI